MSEMCIIVAVRLHLSTLYIDAACCYQPSSVVCQFVGWSVGLAQ